MNFDHTEKTKALIAKLQSFMAEFIHPVERTVAGVV